MELNIVDIVTAVELTKWSDEQLENYIKVGFVKEPNVITAAKAILVIREMQKAGLG